MSNRGGNRLDWTFLRIHLLLLAFLACIVFTLISASTRGALSGITCLLSLLSVFIGWILLTKETK